jgi:hypothetical protein
MLANNTRYGLAASVWSETIGLALDIAPKLMAGVVWVNATNQCSTPAVGFGGYRESGFGREGGREGMYEYLKPKAWSGRKVRAKAPALPTASSASAGFDVPPIDRTAKLFVGGKQVRPDGNYSRAVLSPKGRRLGEAGEGNRKDIRNAVAAARAAESWARATAHNRAQILYYLAENLSARGDEFARRLADMTGASAAKARIEVDASIERLFSYGAWADKFEGSIHAPPLRGVALAMHEPIGVVGVACPDEAPLLAFISLVAPLIAMGNRVVAVPSERHPLAATDFYQVLETSDVPGGVLNIVTGESKVLAKTLAEHDGIDAIWFAGDAETSAMVEKASAGNVKQAWTSRGLYYDLSDPRFEGDFFLRRATQVKNVWIQETIINKRDGVALTSGEIKAFIAGLTDGSVEPRPGRRLRHGGLFRDMDRPLSASRSPRPCAIRGTVLDWSDLDGPVADKHSTGGVGDNVSLMLAPILAACGVYVPMISGRGLGHTGGTLDKFDSIPGYSTSPDNDVIPQGGARGRLRHHRPDRRPRPGRQGALRHPRRHRHGRIHPADHRLDPVEETRRRPRRADPRREDRLRRLHADARRSPARWPRASSRSPMARACDAALITDMNEPLASAAGNALEIRNAVDFLTGRHQDPRLREVTLACAPPRSTRRPRAMPAPPWKARSA